MEDYNDEIYEAFPTDTENSYEIEETYSDYEEAESNYDVQSYEGVQGLDDKIQTAMAVADQVHGIADSFAQSKKADAQMVVAQEWSKVQVAKTIAKFQTDQSLINRTFDERKSVLDDNRTILQNAIKSGDREMILAAMRSSADIVTNSPLENIAKASKIMKEKEEEAQDLLLDF